MFRIILRFPLEGQVTAIFGSEDFAAARKVAGEAAAQAVRAARDAAFASLIEARAAFATHPAPGWPRATATASRRKF